MITVKCDRCKSEWVSDHPIADMLDIGGVPVDLCPICRSQLANLVSNHLDELYRAKIEWFRAEG